MDKPVIKQSNKSVVFREIKLLKKETVSNLYSNKFSITSSTEKKIPMNKKMLNNGKTFSKPLRVVEGIYLNLKHIPKKINKPDNIRKDATLSLILF